MWQANPINHLIDTHIATWRVPFSFAQSNILSVILANLEKLQAIRTECAFIFFTLLRMRKPPHEMWMFAIHAYLINHFSIWWLWNF